MATYVPPEWGVDGANAFGISLEVIKSGVVVERLELPLDANKSCVVAVCDLVLQHPSISRVHAALQFDAHGALFLRDLESTHGTFVNKQRVPANEYVRLHIGDIVVFGESTRLYALCGPQELLPAEYDSQNLQQLREKSEQRQEKKALERQQCSSRSSSRESARDDSGASWGFREDAVDDDNDDGSDDDDSSSSRGKEQLPDYLRNLKDDDATAYTSSVQASDVSEKDAKLFQQLQARISKMTNLTLEKSRIQAKQHQLTGLTDGQRQTLERNEQRIHALRKEIEDIEDRIHAKNAQRAKTKAGTGAASTGRSKTRASDALYGYDSDEDDFYDRTATNQRKHAARKTQLGVESSSTSADVVKTAGASASSSNGGALTAESIQLQITRLERTLQEVETAIDTAKAVAARDAGAQTEHEDDTEVDSLDSFMASTTHALHASELTALTQKREDVATELRRQRELLVVATPALARVSAPPVRESVAPPVAAAAEKAEEKEPTVASTEPAPAASPAPKRAAPSEPPVVLSEVASVSTASTSTSTSSTSSSGDAEKAMTASAPSQPALVADDNAAAQRKKRRVVGPARPPPAAAAQSTARTASRSDVVATSASTLEGGDRVWVPPANQTGDGRTALNDKFGY